MNDSPRFSARFDEEAFVRTSGSHPASTRSLNIAQALNVSIDYLAIDDMPRRPFRVDDHGLTERLAALAELDHADRDNLLNVPDAVIARKGLQILGGTQARQRQSRGHPLALEGEGLTKGRAHRHDCYSL